MNPTLVSVQVGRVRTLGDPAAANPLQRPWRTAYRKEPVAGRRRITRTGVEGDEQFERRVHGGPEMAVLCYSGDHYPLWREELELPAMGPGAFGENFTVTGLDEQRVAIGDVFAVGEGKVQVASPRGPCANISRYWNLPGLLERVIATGRTGWYLRVLEEGTVAGGDELRCIERPCPEWTVSRVFRLRLEPALDPEAAARIAECATLAPAWRKKIAARAQARS